MGDGEDILWIRGPSREGIGYSLEWLERDPENRFMWGF